MPMGDPIWIRAGALLIAAGLASAALILILMPTFTRYALARPNERSSHRTPTPQGGGAAVIAATIVVFVIAESLLPDAGSTLAAVAPLGAAVVLLAVVGVVDDIFTVAELPRLVLQAIAVGAVVMTLATDFRVLPMLPLSIERAGEILAGLWFVNLTNFMDGIDWITVAETVPITASIFLFSLDGAVSPPAGLAALTLCGAMLGFAPFNRPVARLFLGDVGSLPIGLILFFLLLQLAGGGHVAAALLLPLYYLADATITLLLRLSRGENVTKAHRSHFYQLAAIRGIPLTRIVGAVFGVNVVLAVLAGVSIAQASARRRCCARTRRRHRRGAPDRDVARQEVRHLAHDPVKLQTFRARSCAKLPRIRRRAQSATDAKRSPIGRRFNLSVADSLDRFVHDNKIEAVVIVAPPRALADLRHAFHDGLKKRIIAEIDKELTNQPLFEIEKHL
jgi:UDP-N-acetylmuramyl pentapeptide phosphotransferase/UDP-N-acetylglucosamine-1-phosphate transferase/protein required for attachment to host cells